MICLNCNLNDCLMGYDLLVEKPLRENHSLYSIIQITVQTIAAGEKLKNKI